MILPNNRFFRLFIKKKYLPAELNLKPLTGVSLLVLASYLLLTWEADLYIKSSVVFSTLVTFSIIVFVAYFGAKHGGHAKKVPKRTCGLVRWPLRKAALFLHYVGVGTKYFFYYIGVGVSRISVTFLMFLHYVGLATMYLFYYIGAGAKGLYKGVLYLFHYVGLGVMYILYYTGVGLKRLYKGVLYLFHYVGLATMYIFYYIGVGVKLIGKGITLLFYSTGLVVEKVSNGMISDFRKIGGLAIRLAIFLKSMFVITFFYSKKGVETGAKKAVEGAKWAWRYVNWIMIFVAAAVAFRIAPINIIEKAFYITVFLTLIVLTYLLREELGVIGRGLQSIVAFVNTKKGFFFVLPLFIFTVSEMLLVNSVENIINIYIFAILFFIVLSTLSGDEKYRNHWGMLTLPVILRIVNLGMPFPIINAKLQLMITYGAVTYCTLLFIKYMNLKVNFFNLAIRFKDYIIAIGIGVGLGTVEYFILGYTPILQTISTVDYVYLLFTIFIIGFGEELVYRLMQTVQTDLFGVKGALFLTSVLFGIMHLIWRNPLEFVFTTFAGLLFGIQFHKTKSILPPTIAHIFNNTAWLIIVPWFRL